jgi:cytochrome c oxidase assembly protein subunit 16
MPTFQSKTFRPSSASSTLAARYRGSLSRHPFLLFGLPFIVTMVAGSFFLTPATAIRYEKHDRKIRQMSEEERLGLQRGEGARKVDNMKEEYYVSVCNCMWLERVLMCGNRDWQRRISTIGSKKG